MKLFSNPYDGSVYDWDAMPQHSNKNHKPGRWCPVTDNPLDEVALANLDLSAMHTPQAKQAYYDSCKAKVDAIMASFVTPTGLNALNVAASEPVATPA